MCLNNSAREVKKFLKKKQKQSFCFAWKVLKKDEDGAKLRSPFAEMYLNTGTDIEYKPGWKYSNSKRAKPSMKDREEISLGIHVHLKKSEAIAMVDRGFTNERCMVRVRCEIADLIGINYNRSSAAFSKVYLSLGEYTRVVMR